MSIRTARAVAETPLQRVMRASRSIAVTDYSEDKALLNIPLLQTLAIEMVLDQDSADDLYNAIEELYMNVRLGGSGEEPPKKALEAVRADNVPLLKTLLIQMVLDMNLLDRLYYVFYFFEVDARDAIKTAEAKDSSRARERQRRKDQKELLLKKLLQRRAVMYPDDD